MISARIVKGRKISGYYSIEDDINNAGATYVNAPVVIDGHIVTSPHYNWMGEWMKTAVALVKAA
jgi:protease I